MQAGLSTKNAPSPKVVVPHYLVSAMALLIAAVVMFFSSNDLAVTFFGPHIVSLTHIMVLGFITTVIFGALYQLIPVVMEVKLYSEKMALLSFYTLVAGAVLLSYSFYSSYLYGRIPLAIGGSLMLISIVVFVINFFKTAATTTVKTVQNRFIIASVVWLSLTVIIGLILAIMPFENFLGKTNMEWMRIHVEIGIMGWFMMLVIGVASILMPMFFISHQLKTKYLEYAFYLTNAGLLAFALCLFFDASLLWNVISVGSLITGLIFFFKYNFDSYKKRLRKKLDIGMKLSVLAFLLLIITLITGVLTLLGSTIDWIDADRMKMLYGASLVFGFFTALILGQMYKTLPFIVWLKLYNDKVGRYKTKMPIDMYSEKFADYHYYSFILAFVSLELGLLLGSEIIIKIAAGFYLITAAFYLINVIRIITHKMQIEPLK